MAAPFDQGERVIRSDRVVRFQQGASRAWRISRMVLTSRRVTFSGPELPLWFSLYAWPAMALRFPLGPPAGGTVEIELASIDRVWPGRDEFSSPPGIQRGEALWNFWLVQDRFPWQERETGDAVREHYDALVAAWSAARRGE
jgi:hypothetical protein